MKEAIDSGQQIGRFAGYQWQMFKAVHVMCNIGIKTDVAYVGYQIAIASGLNPAAQFCRLNERINRTNSAV